MRGSMAAARGHGDSSRVRRAVLSGFCASLLGIGLARFAYPPLIPALVEAHWFTPAGAAYLGAANLAGYLAGALLARPMAQRSSAPTVLRAMMVLATLAFFACAAPLSFLWFALWRFAAGLAGGALMVLAAPTVLPQVAPAQRGLAGGVVFTGVGLGIAASGTVVPWFLTMGLAGTWCGLGALAAVLTLLSWHGWQAAEASFAPPAMPAPSAPTARPTKSRARVPLALVHTGYALNAAGLVPHMVFLVDFVARGLGAGLETGAWYWVLFGIGATFGPVLAGRAADRVGFGPALRLAFAIQTICVGWLAIAADPFALAASSFVVGAFVPGIVPLVLGRIYELIPDDPVRQKAAWSVATAAFAVGQAAAAYGLSFLFADTGSYTLLFLLGAAAILLALAGNMLAITVGAITDTRLRGSTVET